MIEQRLDILSGLAGNKSDRAIGHRRKMLAQIPNPTLGRNLTSQLIPLVHDKNARLELVSDVVRQLLVHLAHGFFAIEEKQNHIRATNAALGSVSSVPIDIGPDTFRSTQTGCIDRHELVPIELEHHIDAIARGTGYFAYDHSLGASQGIHESALADVSTTDDGNLHRGWFDISGTGLHDRQPFDDQIQQLLLVAVLHDADAHQPPPAELMELVRVGILGGVVRLVGYQQDRFVHLAKPIRDLGIQGNQAAAGIDDKQ